MRTIDADELKNIFDWVEVCNLSKKEIKDIIDNEPTVNSFTIDELKKWLYRIAFNNSNNHFGDYCVELVGRLDGFMNFVKDLRKGRIV